MKLFLNGFTKIEAAATVLPVAMVFAVLTVPVQSDNTDTSIPMEFDSVGAMLRDIDREKSLDSMTGYAVVDLRPAIAEPADVGEFEVAVRTDSHTCPDSDVKVRMNNLQAQLHIQLAAMEMAERFNAANLAEIEREVARLRLSEISRLAGVKDEAIAAKVEMALKAAEAALKDLK